MHEKEKVKHAMDCSAFILGNISNQLVLHTQDVTPGFKDKTECIAICMPGSSFIHIETL